MSSSAEQQETNLFEKSVADVFLTSHILVGLLVLLVSDTLDHTGGALLTGLASWLGAEILARGFATPMPLSRFILLCSFAFNSAHGCGKWIDDILQLNTPLKDQLIGSLMLLTLFVHYHRFRLPITLTLGMITSGDLIWEIFLYHYPDVLGSWRIFQLFLGGVFWLIARYSSYPAAQTFWLYHAAVAYWYFPGAEILSKYPITETSPFLYSGILLLSYLSLLFLCYRLPPQRYLLLTAFYPFWLATNHLLDHRGIDIFQIMGISACLVGIVWYASWRWLTRQRLFTHMAR